MIKTSIEEFLATYDSVPIIDVRSPSEFSEGHIPGAVNIPVFSNEERAEIGTIYKQEGKKQAIEQGLTLVGPKLKALAVEAQLTASNGIANLYCWRGGMRSEKMSWLFELVGVTTGVLSGGYKAYRKCLMEVMGGLTTLIILQGPTGSGKTSILSSLKNMGEQVIDLEGLANHKGSAFGGLGKSIQPTTQQFQNDIFATVMTLNTAKRIWIESESLTVGRVYLPEPLWQQMNYSRILSIDLSKEIRLQRIVKEYGGFDQQLLIKKVQGLSQRMGESNVRKVCEHLQNGDIEEAATSLLSYYDRMYKNSSLKHKSKKPIKIGLQKDDPDENAKSLILKANELNY